MIALLKKQRLSSILGLSLDGGSLEGVVLRRTNGSLEIGKSFSTPLSLDPLTNEPELVGREIRNHLDKAGIRERRCAVCLPLNWALTQQTKLPALPEADIDNFLQIEAERGFPYGAETLFVSSLRNQLPSGDQFAAQVAIPRDHLRRIEKALAAAKLKPVAFSLGITALQSPVEDPGRGIMALVIGERGVGLQAAFGGGIAALRMLEGTVENEGGRRHVDADLVAREIRITLGQLPAEVRDAMRHLRVFGPEPQARRLVDELRPRAEAMGLSIEWVASYPPDQFRAHLPPGVPVSSALSVAARHLAAGGAVLDFLPPKARPWQQLATRYSSKKLVWLGATAGSIALLVALCFLVQQWQLSRWRGKWSKIAPRVAELEQMQHQIKKFRPWFDESCRVLTILRKLTEAFPEDGSVAAKTVEVRELSAVTCSGTARDSDAFYKTLDRLSSIKGIADVKTDQIRGKAPVQFTFNFSWVEGGANDR